MTHFYGQGDGLIKVQISETETQGTTRKFAQFYQILYIHYLYNYKIFNEKKAKLKLSFQRYGKKTHIFGLYFHI